MLRPTREHGARRDLTLERGPFRLAVARTSHSRGRSRSTVSFTWPPPPSATEIEPSSENESVPHTQAASTPRSAFPKGAALQRVAVVVGFELACVTKSTAATPCAIADVLEVCLFVRLPEGEVSDMPEAAPIRYEDHRERRVDAMGVDAMGAAEPGDDRERSAARQHAPGTCPEFARRVEHEVSLHEHLHTSRCRERARSPKGSSRPRDRSRSLHTY